MRGICAPCRWSLLINPFCLISRPAWLRAPWCVPGRWMVRIKPSFISMDISCHLWYQVISSPSLPLLVERQRKATPQILTCSCFGPCHILRSYCNTDLHPEHRHLSQLDAIKLYLKGKEPLLQCECTVCACGHSTEWTQNHTPPQLPREALLSQRWSVPVNPAECLLPTGAGGGTGATGSHTEPPVTF